MNTSSLHSLKEQRRSDILLAVTGGDFDIHSNDMVSSQSFKVGDDVSIVSTTNHRHSDAGGGGIQQQAAKLERQTLAKEETKAVFILRIIMLSILLVTGVAVCSLVFLYTRNQEVSEFEESFAASAARVIDAFQESIQAQLGTLDSFSVTLTSHAIAYNETFPFVSLPHFEIRAATTRIAAKGFLLYHTPIVQEHQLDEWTKYTNSTINEINRQLESETLFRTLQDQSYGLQPVINNSYVDENGKPYIYRDTIWGPPKSNITFPSTIYLPIWQFSPFIPAILRTINFDATRFNLARTENLLHVYKTNRASLSSLFNVPQKVDTGRESVANSKSADNILKNSQFRHKVKAYIGDPISVMNYPVFDSFDITNRKLVGILASNLYWRSYFTDVLPPNIEGIICVLKNTANQTFTYRIDGKDANIVGGEDYHDSKYNHLVATEELTSYVKSKSSPEIRGYTSVHLNPDNIKHHIYVYPSQDTENLYVTKKPYIYTAIVALVFVFTSLIFLFYDYLVERRQGIVMNRAVTSTAVVSSLFPEQVRDQILDGVVEKDTTNNTNGKKNHNEWKRVDNIMNKKDLNMNGIYNNANSNDNDLQDDTTKNNYNYNNKHNINHNRPIADKFLNATVLFADIAGFTQWSSKREPDEVFILLETLFGKLDKIALRRKVFKVETIGDCYMAVTGVPKEQPDHAIIMSKFARDAILNSSDIFTSLGETLGSGTSDLNLRIGLNSGEVTAGVLRGEKTRFQLFGDTVNTASRMESLGIKGKIHCSQSTADELILNGHKPWLVPREGTIVAKGKGEMQTYFLDGLMKASTKTMSVKTAMTDISIDDNNLIMDSTKTSLTINHHEEEDEKDDDDDTNIDNRQQ